MKIKLTALAAAMFISLPAHAGFMSTVDGTGADIASKPQMSVEVSKNKFAKEFDWTGARANYKVSETMMVFGTFGKVDAKDIALTRDFKASFDGNSFGGGVIMDAPYEIANMHTAIKLSYHKSDLDDKGGNTVGGRPATFSIASTAMTAKFLISPEQPMNDAGMTWYAAVGYSNASSKISNSYTVSDADGKVDKKGFAGSVGVVYPLSFGEAYAGFETVASDNQIGGGIRISF